MVSEMNGMIHKYKPRNFDYILGIEGLSDQLLKNHFSLYNAYVENTNKLFQELDIARHSRICRNET